jgi:hypothetical protein
MRIGVPLAAFLTCAFLVLMATADTPTAVPGLADSPSADQDLQDKVVFDAYDWLYGPANIAANRQAIAGLQRPLALSVEDKALEKVLAYFGDITDTNVVPNWKAMEGAGIDRNSLVTVKIPHEVPAYKVLDVILQYVGGGTANLGWTLDSGIISISTRDELNGARYQVTLLYDTRDIFAKLDPQESYDDRFRDLTETLKSTIAPDSWRDNGGTIGSIREFRGRLMINQTSSNHRAIHRFLDQIRAAEGLTRRPAPVRHSGAAPVVRTPTVSRAEEERAGREWGTPRPPEVPTLNMLGGRSYEPGK